MPNYRYNTPDYMRQTILTDVMSVEATEQCRLLYHRPHRPVRAVIFTITTN